MFVDREVKWKISGSCALEFPPRGYRRVSFPGVFEVDYIRERYFGAIGDNRTTLAVRDTITECTIFVDADKELKLEEPETYVTKLKNEAPYPELVLKAEDEFYERCEDGNIAPTIISKALEETGYSNDVGIVVESKSICSIELENSTLKLNISSGNEKARFVIVDRSVFAWMITSS